MKLLDTLPGPDYVLFVAGGIDSEHDTGCSMPSEKRNFLSIDGIWKEYQEHRKSRAKDKVRFATDI